MRSDSVFSFFLLKAVKKKHLVSGLQNEPHLLTLLILIRLIFATSYHSAFDLPIHAAPSHLGTY